MSKSKFNLNKLPDLKIRVNNAEESERVQHIFFALHYGWHDSDFDNLDSDGIMVALQFGIFAYAGTKILSSCLFPSTFFNSKTTEITLAELESLAAEKRLQSCTEKPTEMGNLPGKGKPTVITYMKVQAYAEGDCDNCGCSVAMKVDVTSEAQKRYDAAVKWLEENADPIVDSEYEDIKCYFDTDSDVLQALRIASGLEPIQSQDNQKQ